MLGLCGVLIGFLLHELDEGFYYHGCWPPCLLRFTVIWNDPDRLSSSSWDSQSNNEFLDLLMLGLLLVSHGHRF